MNRILFFTCLLLAPFFNTAQVIWETADQQEVVKIPSEERVIQPHTFNLIKINPQALSDKLVTAQDRFSGSNGIAIDFPTGNDTFETFMVYDSGAMAKGLKRQFPKVRSYFGKSVDNNLNTIYFTITPQGFRGLITGEKIIYMDPYAKSVPNIIMSYNRNHVTRRGTESYECQVRDELTAGQQMDIEAAITAKAFQDRQFRTYEIAIAATGEYTAYHDDGNAGNGNAVADALAAIVVTVTRVNSVYEKDMSMRFSLVANNSNIIYTNSQTDPYSNYSGFDMLAENVSNLNSVIGAANFDIGHVFSTGGGGIAGTSPCGSGKARGVTGIVTPAFDPFDIDYVSHEIGHQFGASHTFYNGCFGGSPSSSPYEAGSASTIMGYAGICAPNVQDNSDAYFHLISLFQMQGSIDSDGCDDQIFLGASNPTAPNAVSPGNKTIPRSTPFKLTSTSSVAPDAGETYTYNWEELEDGSASATGATQPPVGTNTTGPLFRSKFATTSPTRYFPNLPDLINNIDPVWEELPSVSREIQFFCTIRDNNPNGGQTDYVRTTLQVGTAGPFLVNAPNGGEIWHEGELKTVTWAVNNTNNTTYSTTVNILLSLDGGLTYPVTLASGTNNDGSQSVTIPTGVKTTQARIMIEAANNYFFDITNNDFEIKEGTFELTAASDDFSVCQPSDGATTFEYNAAPDFNESVAFSALGLPAGLTASFTPSSTTTDATVSISISGTAGVAANQYDFSVEAQSTSVTLSKNFTFKLFNNAVGDVLQVTPANGAANQVANPLLQWQDLASASSYLIEISENSDFSIITESNTVSFQNTYQPTTLVHSTIYYWRVTPSNDCISGTAASISLFQTAQDVCTTYDNETYVNTAQPPNRQDEWDTTVNAVAAKVVVTDDIEVTKLSFYMNATHSDTGDIKMQLSAPTGRFAEVYNRECANGADFDLIVSDDGTQNFGCASSYTGALTGNQRPGQAFTRFNDASALGEWVLLATDRTSGTGGTGTFNQFSVTVCGRLQYVNDIDNDLNLGLTTSFNATNVIDNSSLRSVQAGFTAANLVYVVTNDVDHGQIQLNGVDLNIGDTFTQGDVDNNLIQYVHTSLELVAADSFGYTVLGSANTVLPGEVFNISIEDPTLIYDAGVWTPFAPHAETGSINAQVLSGTAPVAVDAAINDISVTAGVLSIASNVVLTVNGNLSVEGELDGTQGTLRLERATAQSISGAGSLELDRLEVNNATGVSFGAVTNIYDVLMPQASVLNANNNIVFKSNATTTGQLDDASAATINGSVRVERYIPAKRAFRFLASSVNSTGSIRENWQENGAVVPSLGTHITGPSAANGFDTNPSGAYSLYTFDNDNYTWSVVPNTNTEQLVIGAPIRLMVRGDRTTDLTNNNATASVTTLRASGAVHTGDFVRSYTTSNGEFAMISNPYQAAVDFKSVLNDVATSGLNANFVYVWDPTLNTRGAYATVDMSTLNGTALPGSSAANKFLQPGQSVFVPTTGASGMTFKESHKAVDQPLTAVFGAYNQNSFITISLKNASASELIDQATMQYDSGFSNMLTQEDAIKFMNLDETLAFTSGADQLSIERRQLPVDGDITPIYLSNYRSNSYTMDLEVSLNAGLTAILVDQEIGTRRLLQDGHNAVSFSVSASGSLDNRFLIEYADSTLSLEEDNLINSISVYPNPVENNSFQVSSTYLLGKEVQLRMYNTLGQKVYENAAVFNGTQTITPSTILSSGMYLLKVSTGEESATVQLIVK